MTTDTWLLIGVVSTVLFAAVVFIESAVRSGYNPTYHTGSELSLGDRGWIQVTNFIQMGVGVVAFAIGVDQALDVPVGAVLLAVYGVGLIGAGVFRPDPMRGYPPNAIQVTRSEQSLHAKIHDALGGPIHLVLFAAVLILAFSLDGAWQVYTVVTAMVGLGLTIGTALSYFRDAAKTGLVQRALLLVYWSWIVLVGIHLVTNPPLS